MVLESLGCGAIPVIRPLTLDQSVVVESGPGPMKVQLLVERSGTASAGTCGAGGAAGGGIGVQGVT
ncbi:MAG TPA: hypothetical protein DIT76_03340 [Spartobacteria bacterium]|nr:hypothetical protein [Spartobacteria bacterium]